MKINDAVKKVAIKITETFDDIDKKDVTISPQQNNAKIDEVDLEVNENRSNNEENRNIDIFDKVKRTFKIDEKNSEIKTSVNENSISSIYYEIVKSVGSAVLNSTIKSNVVKLFKELVSPGFVHEEDIDKIDFRGINSENIKVTLKNGYEYLFVNNNGRISLSTITSRDNNKVYLDEEKGLMDVWDSDYGKIENIDISPDGENIIIENKDGVLYSFNSQTKKIQKYTDYDNQTKVLYDYNIDENERNQICGVYGLDSNVNIDFIARSEIKGNEIKYYSINAKPGENTSAVPLNFTKLYSECYSEKILSLLNEHFNGIFISPWDYASNPDLQGSAGAYVSYASDKPFMYVPSDVDFDREYYTVNTPLHEMGHAIQWIEEKLNIFENNVLTNCFEKYKDLLPQLYYSCYSNLRGVDQTPSEAEFFADISVNYFKDPETLNRYIPEAYELAKKMYG